MGSAAKDRSRVLAVGLWVQAVKEVNKRAKLNKTAERLHKSTGNYKWVSIPTLAQTVTTRSENDCET